MSFMGGSVGEKRSEYRGFFSNLIFVGGRGEKGKRTVGQLPEGRSKRMPRMVQGAVRT